MGLVTRVSEDAPNEAERLAKKIAQQPPTAILHTKALLKSGSHEALKAVMNAEAELFTLALQSQEAQSALMKFAAARGRK